MSIQPGASIKVAEVMLSLDLCPVVSTPSILKAILDCMDQNRLGVVCITDKSGCLTGILTEGDLRRILLRVQKPLAAILADDVDVYAVGDPVTVFLDTSLKEAVLLMEAKRIWDLPVVTPEGKLVGLLHLHQAILSLITT